MRRKRLWRLSIMRDEMPGDDIAEGIIAICLILAVIGLGVMAGLMLAGPPP